MRHADARFVWGRYWSLFRRACISFAFALVLLFLGMFTIILTGVELPFWNAVGLGGKAIGLLWLVACLFAWGVCMFNAYKLLNMRCPRCRNLFSYSHVESFSANRRFFNQECVSCGLKVGTLPPFDPEP